MEQGTENTKPLAKSDTPAQDAPDKEKPDSVHNIFDTVFRTVIEYFPHLVIPVINEVFGTRYPADESLAVLKNEHVTWGGKTVTDLFFELGKRYFHVECQSATDGRMIIRIMEYAAAIAIENAAEAGDGSFRMRFPSSCVVYLRSSGNTPDKLTMHVDFPNGESVAFDVPLLKVREYTKDELFQKDLLMLLPYYLMRYEEECRAAGRAEGQDEADQRMSVFMEECGDVLGRLSEACAKREQQYLFQTLADLILEVARYLAPDNEKGRVEAMGGTVLKTRAQIIMEQGIEKGIKQGIEKGIEKGIKQGIEKGIEKGIEQGEMKAKRETAFSLANMGMPPEKIAQAVKVGMDTVKQWLEGEAALAK